MKKGSIVKLSFHNMFHNKLRTLLTCIVLFVMATVIMMLSALGFSLYESVSANVKYKLQTEGAEMKVSYLEKAQDGNYKTQGFLSMNNVNQIIDDMDNENNPLFDYIEFAAQVSNIKVRKIGQSDGNYESINAVHMKTSPETNNKDFLVAGRMWNPSDENSTNIWINKKANEIYKIGDKIEYMYYDQDKDKNINFFGDQVFTVCGVVDNYNYSDNCIYMDYSFFDDEVAIYDENGYPTDDPYFMINEVKGVVVPQDDIIYGMETKNRLQDFEKKYNIATYRDDGKVGTIVSCGILEDFVLSDMILISIIAIVLFLSLIIISLSIGCMANTIKITVEQNRRFFGMMKALGMQNKVVRQIVQGQAMIMTIISVAISTGVVAGAIGIMRAIIEDLVIMLFGGDAIVIATLNPLVPLVVFAMLAGSVLLFTRSSLMKISKMDVISVISEVN